MVINTFARERKKPRLRALRKSPEANLFKKKKAEGNAYYEVDKYIHTELNESTIGKGDWQT